MKLFMLPRFTRLGASSRLRSYQFLPWFERAGFEITIQILVSDALLNQKYSRGKYQLFDIAWAYCQRAFSLLATSRHEMLWIEKELFPFLPFSFERLLLLGRPYVIDYDDAVFHTYDVHSSKLVRWVLGKKIDRLMSHATCVTVGNSYLAERALASGARKVVIVPTVVDLERYQDLPARQGNGQREEVVIGWIGSPTTQQYLQLIAKPLAELSKTFNFRLRVICLENLNLPGVITESIPWSEAEEVSLLQGCDIGVMPLNDSFFERGKCGYKLIQYMACGLPVIASPVGVNVSIVQEGINGYLAQTEAEWLTALATLISQPSMRMAMGASGRKLVEQRYSVQVVAGDLIDAITDASLDA